MDSASARHLFGCRGRDRILILDGGTIVANGSAEQLAKEVAGTTEGRWTRAGQRHVHSTADGTGYVRDLFTQYGEEIEDLEVRRASLEDTYLSMVARSERKGEPVAMDLAATGKDQS